MTPETPVVSVQTPCLWRWLSRAVAQGVVRHEGSGRPHDPFRYWLPARQEMMRPDGGTAEEMQAWNDRCAAALFDSWAQERPATPRRAPFARPGSHGDRRGGSRPANDAAPRPASPGRPRSGPARLAVPD